MFQYFKGLSLAAIILVALPALAVSTLGRMELDWPDFGDPGGASQVTTIQDSMLDVSDNSANRVFEATAVADSGVTTFRHNFGLNIDDLEFFMYTGTGSSKVFINPVTAGYLIADNGGSPKLEVDVTAPSSGGPHDFTIVVSWSAVGAGTGTNVGGGASTVIGTAGVAIEEGQAVYGLDDGAGGLEVYPFEFEQPVTSRNALWTTIQESLLTGAPTLTPNQTAYFSAQNYVANIWSSGTSQFYTLNRLSADPATGETIVTNVLRDTLYNTVGFLEINSFCYKADGSEVLRINISNATGDGEAQVVTPGASALTFETPFAWETTGDIRAFSCAHDPVNDVYGIFWTETGAGSNIFSRMLSVTGTTVSAAGPEAFSLETGRTSPRVTWSVPQAKFFLFYVDGNAANEIVYWRYANTDGAQITSYDTEQTSSFLFDVSGASTGNHGQAMISYDDNLVILEGAGQKFLGRAVAMFDVSAATPTLEFSSHLGDGLIFQLIKSANQDGVVYVLEDPGNGTDQIYLQTLNIDTVNNLFTEGPRVRLLDDANKVTTIQQGDFLGLMYLDSTADPILFMGLTESAGFRGSEFVGLANDNAVLGAAIEVTLEGANYDASNFPGIAGDPAYSGYDGKLSIIPRIGDYRIGTYLESDTVRIDTNSYGIQVAAAGRPIEEGDLLYSTRTTGTETTLAGLQQAFGDLEARPLEFLDIGFSTSSDDLTDASSTAVPHRLTVKGQAYMGLKDFHSVVYQDQTTNIVYYYSYTVRTEEQNNFPAVNATKSATAIHTGAGDEGPMFCSSDDNTEHLLLYVDGGDGKAEVVSPGADGTLVFGATFTWEVSSDVQTYDCAYDPVNDSYGIFYTENAGAGSVVYSRVLKVSGTTASAPNARVADVVAARSFPSVSWDDLTGKYLLAHHDFAGTVGFDIQLVSTDGNQVTTYHTPSTANNARMTSPPSIAENQVHGHMIRGTQGYNFYFPPSTSNPNQDPNLWTVQTFAGSTDVFNLTANASLGCREVYGVTSKFVKETDTLVITCKTDDEPNYTIQSYTLYRLNNSIRERVVTELDGLAVEPDGGAALLWDEKTDAFYLVYLHVTTLYAEPFFLKAEMGPPSISASQSAHGEINFLGVATADADENANVTYSTNNSWYTNDKLSGVPGQSAFIGWNRKLTHYPIGDRVGSFTSPNTVAVRKDPTKISLQYKLNTDVAVLITRIVFNGKMHDNTWGAYYNTSTGIFTSPRKARYAINGHVTVNWPTAPININTSVQMRVNGVIDLERTLEWVTQDLVDGSATDYMSMGVNGTVALEEGENISIWYSGKAGTGDATFNGVTTWFSIQELDY
jgi:hypothetical protein